MLIVVVPVAVVVGLVAMLFVVDLLVSSGQRSARSELDRVRPELSASGFECEEWAVFTDELIGLPQYARGYCALPQGFTLHFEYTLRSPYTAEEVAGIAQRNGGVCPLAYNDRLLVYPDPNGSFGTKVAPDSMVTAEWMPKIADALGLTVYDC
jgi:hypothetical protein